MRARVKLVAFGLSVFMLGSGAAIAKDKEESDSGRAGKFWKQSAQGAPSVRRLAANVSLPIPEDADAQNDLGWALRQNGDVKGAEDCLRQALSLNDKLAYAHSNLSVVLLDKGNKEEALEQKKRSRLHIWIANSPYITSFMAMLCSPMAMQKKRSRK